MTLVDIEAPPVDKAKRNGNGQYLVLPANGRKRVGWTRATTFAKTISDQQFEDHWKRTTLAGGHLNPDLAAECHRLLEGGENHAAGKVAGQAFTLAGGNVKRDRGTLVHSYVENKLRDDAYVVPELYREQVDAIIAHTRAAGFEFITDLCEQMVVIDALKIAGTVDFYLYHAETDTYYIGDLKTGSVNYGALEWAIQLYLYAIADCGYVQGDAEDGSDDQRIDLPAVNRSRAVIINSPLDTTDVDLYWLDITNGPALVELCVKVREARRLKSKVLTKFEGGGTDAPAGVDPVAHAAEVVGSVEDNQPPAAALAILHETRTAWLINRTAHLVKTLGKEHVAQVWPVDVARPLAIKSGEAVWTVEDTNLISFALDALEAKHDVPFGYEDPVLTHARRMELESKVAAEVERTTVTPAPEPSVDGAPYAPADAVKNLTAIVKAMAAEGTPDEQARIRRVQHWQAQGTNKRVPWKIGNLAHDRVPERLFSIVAAAVGCLDLIEPDAADPDSRVRDLLGVVLEDHDLAQQPSHPVGALFGLLTTDQAHRLADMAETATQATKEQHP